MTPDFAEQFGSNDATIQAHQATLLSPPPAGVWHTVNSPDGAGPTVVSKAIWHFHLRCQRVNGGGNGNAKAIAIAPLVPLRSPHWRACERRARGSYDTCTPPRSARSSQSPPARNRLQSRCSSHRNVAGIPRLVLPGSDPAGARVTRSSRGPVKVIGHRGPHPRPPAQTRESVRQVTDPYSGR